MHSEQCWCTTIQWRSKPSRDDIEMTREVKAAAEALGIAIHDHLVLAAAAIVWWIY